MRSRLTGSPLMLSTPSIIWMRSPGKPDDALDVVGGVVLRQAEHDHVAAVDRLAEMRPEKIGGENGNE